MGTYVVFETDSAYSEECFREYSMLPDKTGKYASLYRPIHMIGLELGISVASRRCARSRPARRSFQLRRGRDRQAQAEGRRDARRRGRLLRLGQADPGDASLKQGYLPLGLAHQVKLKNDIGQGQRLKWNDVEYDPNSLAVRVRREMEAAFRQPNIAA